MIEKAKELLERYRMGVVYLVVGGLTTLVNFIVYFIAIEIFCIQYLMSNIFAWVAAVLFAYVANRKWVFRSRNKDIFGEVGLFVASRIFSLFLETGFLYAVVDILHINDILAKAIIAFVVIVCNYVMGKSIVFKGRR